MTLLQSFTAFRLRPLLLQIQVTLFYTLWGLTRAAGLLLEPPWGDEGGDGLGILKTRLVILHSDWSSGSKKSSVALHWTFFPLVETV